MKRLLNTLFITTQDSYLHKVRETLEVRVKSNSLGQFPVHTLAEVVCFGRVTMSPVLMGFLAERGVSVSFLTEYGRFLAKVVGPTSGNVLLRTQQYKLAQNPEDASKVAQWIVASKLRNSRTAVLRTLRDHGETMEIQLKDKLEQTRQILSEVLDRQKFPKSLDEIRGDEGEAARAYFNSFDSHITQNKNDFTFEKRSRRPPLNRLNALISFFYTLLANDIRAALETVGLDPQVGFLHAMRPGRPGLALDILEEFRSVLADRLAFSLINRGQLVAKDFKFSESGAVYLSDSARKSVLVAFQERKREEMIHPFLKEKMPIGMFFFCQALLMARYIRGDLDNYPPFIWR